MKFDITIDAHHAGHLELRLCRFIVESDDQDVSSCTLLHRASGQMQESKIVLPTISVTSVPQST